MRGKVRGRGARGALRTRALKHGGSRGEIADSLRADSPRKMRVPRVTPNVVGVTVERLLHWYAASAFARGARAHIARARR